MMIENALEAAPAQKSLSRGSMGTFELAFFVVAAAGPLLVVAGYAPLAIALGGIGAPGAQLIAGIVLLLFSVGFTRMALAIKNPGAFYSYIGRSLGKPLGGASALLALASYSAIAIGQLGAFASFANGTVKRLLGIDLPWPVFAIGALLIVAYLGHRRISFSAKVLGVALLAEVLILVILAVPVLVTGGGSDGITLEPFAPAALFSGGGVGAMFTIAFGAFVGFESTAVYAEEARNPRKTVPRATFLAIAFLSVFYAFMMWIIVVAFGKAGALATATNDPTGMFFTATDKYVGHPATVVMEILLVTSAFASTLAFHNTASRYLFTLGRERLLPTHLAATHPKNGSPWVSSLTQAILSLVVIVIFAVTGADPYLNLFLWLSSPAILGIVLLQALCSVAIIVFFRRNPRIRSASAWSTVVAPVAATAGLGVAAYLIVVNFDLLTGRTGWANTGLILCVPLVFAVGLTTTLMMRKRHPEQYAQLIQYDPMSDREGPANVPARADVAVAPEPGS